MLEVSVSPANAARNVRPDSPVRVSASGGELTSVVVTSGKGGPIAGELTGDGRSWENTDPLAPGTRYTVTARARSAAGGLATSTSSFVTVDAATMSTTLIPGDDWVVGVGMPVIVVFGKPVKNRQAAVAALSVTSTPQVLGAWRWMSDTEVQWRPQVYWPSGTKVTVKANTSGVELAPGTWGRRTVTSTFSIGRAQISTVDVAKHTLTVRRAGSTIKTIPVTTGKKGFLTRNGVKVVMSREAQVRMDAASTGTDAKDPEYYNIQVKWALRLTYSGEYLHAAPWSVGSQGRANVSHGCTGMSTANAKWMFDNSIVGDVVQFANSPRPLEWGNGYTVWNKPFAAWSEGA